VRPPATTRSARLATLAPIVATPTIGPPDASAAVLPALVATLVFVPPAPPLALALVAIAAPGRRAASGPLIAAATVVAIASWSPGATVLKDGARGFVTWSHELR
jgi:hypothetical protein